MTREETIKLLAMVRANYPNVKISDPAATATAWEMALGGYTAEAVFRAARLHMTTSKFFPTPADILDKIVRQEIVYNGPLLKTIPAPKPKALVTDIPDENVEEYLEAFTEWIGFGCEPNDDSDLGKFIPFEI